MQTGRLFANAAALSVIAGVIGITGDVVTGALIVSQAIMVTTSAILVVGVGLLHGCVI